MGYCKYEIGDLVKKDGEPYIIYDIKHTEGLGRLYGIQSSKSRFEKSKLEFVPREYFKMWTNSKADE